MGGLSGHYCIIIILMCLVSSQKKMIQNIFLGEYEKITLLKLQKKLLIIGGSEAMYRENKGMSYHNEPRMAKAKAVLVSVVIAFD